MYNSIGIGTIHGTAVIIFIFLSSWNLCLWGDLELIILNSGYENTQLFLNLFYLKTTGKLSKSWVILKFPQFENFNCDKEIIPT